MKQHAMKAYARMVTYVYAFLTSTPGKDHSHSEQGRTGPRASVSVMAKKKLLT